MSKGRRNQTRCPEKIQYLAENPDNSIDIRFESQRTAHLELEHFSLQHEHSSIYDHLHAGKRVRATWLTRDLSKNSAKLIALYDTTNHHLFYNRNAFPST